MDGRDFTHRTACRNDIATSQSLQDEYPQVHAHKDKYAHRYRRCKANSNYGLVVRQRLNFWGNVLNPTHCDNGVMYTGARENIGKEIAKYQGLQGIVEQNM